MRSNSAAGTSEKRTYPYVIAARDVNSDAANRYWLANLNHMSVKEKSGISEFESVCLIEAENTVLKRSEASLARHSGDASTDARRYVLSAGRTGTVFLEGLIGKQSPNTTAVHEPSEVRYQMMLANMRNDWGIAHAPLASWFNRSRQARENVVNGTYVELNPFLCAMTDLLPDENKQLRVLHMVRKPSDWARSITTFKASRKFRNVVDYVPFAKPYPAPRPKGWRGLTDYEKALWRWKWCNERILDIQDKCERYALVRYEDLFFGSPENKQKAVTVIFDTLGLGGAPDIDRIAMTDRVNPAPSTGSVLDADDVLARKICEPLARHFGYHD